MIRVEIAGDEGDHPIRACLCRRVSDKRSAPGNAFDQTFHFDVLKRQANRTAAHFEMFDELTFRGDTGRVRPASRQNQLTQLIVKLSVERNNAVRGNKNVAGLVHKENFFVASKQFKISTYLYIHLEYHAFWLCQIFVGRLSGQMPGRDTITA